MGVANTIVCIDCGGDCYQVPLDPPELGWQVGDVVTYRCRDCADLWYIELESDDLAPWGLSPPDPGTDD